MVELYWMGNTLKIVREFPDYVKREIGFALYCAEVGEKALGVTPLVGFGNAQVLEIISNHDGDTFRAVYTVQFDSAIYVLDSFKKKSKKGISTPDYIIKRIRERLKVASDHHRRMMKEKEEDREKSADLKRKDRAS